MNKVVVASLLAVSGMISVARIAAAQSQVNLGSNAQATGGGEGFGPQHGGGGLLGGRECAFLHVERVAIHRGAVAVVALDEDQSDGRRSHRQPEHRVHMYPFGPTRWTRHMTAVGTGRTRAGYGTVR